MCLVTAGANDIAAGVKGGDVTVEHLCLQLLLIEVAVHLVLVVESAVCPCAPIHRGGKEGLGGLGTDKVQDPVAASIAEVCVFGVIVPLLEGQIAAAEGTNVTGDVGVDHTAQQQLLDAAE